jgi:hypothetical protein
MKEALMLFHRLERPGLDTLVVHELSLGVAEDGHTLTLTRYRECNRVNGGRQQPLIRVHQVPVLALLRWAARRDLAGGPFEKACCLSEARTSSERCSRRLPW